MVIKSKILKFSSLCVIGTITIIVNQMMVSKATEGNTLASVEQNAALEGVAVEGEEDLNYIDNESMNYSFYQKVLDTEEYTVEAFDELIAIGTGEADEKEIPGINYKDYINWDSYTNLGIANVEQYLNVRKSAGTTSTIIAKLPPQAGCTILETTTLDSGEEWAKIKSGEITGYVLSSYLITGQQALDLVPIVGRLVVRSTCDALNVREQASTDAKKLFQIDSSEPLDVISVTDEWVQVAVDFSTGNETEEGEGENQSYVAREYVNFTFELQSAIDMDEILTGCSKERAGIVAYAKKFLGNPYVYGGTSLTNGIDCSAFVRALYAEYGYSLHRTSSAQGAYDGVKISESELQPGDLVFYSNGKGSITHVAMFIGNGKIIHASNPRSGIKINNMKYTTPARYKRIFTD